jgi:hypothetical protein
VASLLTDELLRHLIAAGEVDILVGLPTQNHEQTVTSVVRAVVSAFSGPLVRLRSVLLNIDGGSTDATRDAIKNTASSAELVSAQYALRTLHRITAPYHGLAGRGTALRILLTAAELLRARAVVVFDPGASDVGPDDVAAFVHAVLREEADYVKPALARGYSDGPLVTQLVRPLVRSAYGRRLLEPIDTQFACSERFVSGVLSAEFWSAPEAETGIDVFLTGHALRGDFRLNQVATAARARVDAERRPVVAEVFRQVVGTLISYLAGSFSAWRGIGESLPVPMLGTLPEPVAGPRFDIAAQAAAFRDGVEALSPLLAEVLDAAVVGRLLVAARAPRLAFDDTLWAETVFQCLGAAIRAAAPADELARLLEPLYLGRLASFLAEEAASGTPDPFEPLALAFESQKLAFTAGPADQEKR